MRMPRYREGSMIETIKIMLFTVAAFGVLSWGSCKLVRLNAWIQDRRAKRAGCVPQRKELDRC